MNAEPTKMMKIAIIFMNSVPSLIRVIRPEGFVLPNGPELSCGGEPRRRGSHSVRGKLRPIVAGCFARAKSSTAGSVSLSDWLGGDTYMLIRIPFRTDQLLYVRHYFQE